MGEVIKLIAENGVLVAIAIVFIYQSLITNKKLSETLTEVSITNKNISKSLDLLKRSQEEDIDIGRETLKKVECMKIKAGYK